MHRIECVRRTPALLGESPVWSDREQVLYWVDIHGSAIHRFDPASGRDEQWNLGENVGSLGLRSNGGAVVALRSGFHFFDFATGHSTPIVNPIAGLPHLRFNDGRCDRQGRFWAGSVNEKREPGTAAIYRLDVRLGCTAMIEGITVANTIAWSPDGDRMYFGCSWERKIFVCDFDRDTGSVGNRQLFAAFARVRARLMAPRRMRSVVFGSPITMAAGSRASGLTGRSIVLSQCQYRVRRAVRSEVRRTIRSTLLPSAPVSASANSSRPPCRARSSH